MFKNTVYKIGRQNKNAKNSHLSDTSKENEVLEKTQTDKNNLAKEYDIKQCKELIEKSFNDNLYLYTQIVIVLIFVVAGFIFKFNGGNSFDIAKESYENLFKTETVYESNFSYQSILSKLKENIEEKYNEFMQTISYVYGKGSNDLFPSNVSLKKYSLKTKGIKPIEGYVTSPFGVRKDPFNSKKKDFHTGMDIAAEKGTFVKACFSGVVSDAGYSNISGNYIRIKTDSEENIETFYGHNQFLFVKAGDKVLQGQVIASVGETGMATGPHVHLEVVYDDVRVNPVYAIE